VSEIARLAVKAARGDASALRGLLGKLADAVEKARESATSAVEALHEADSMLAEGCGKLPEAKLHVRVTSSRARAAADELLELAGAIGAALAFIELAERERAGAPPVELSQTERGESR
jgi:hypothetical protein